MKDAHAPTGQERSFNLEDKSIKVCVAWLGLAMALSLALAGCSSNNSTAVTITISPGSGTVLLGTSFQFTPAVAGSLNGVQWSVNGVPNGNATVGTIDSTGLYTAPTTLPSPPSGAVVPVILCMANSEVPNSGTTGATIELQAGSNFTNFVAGNTITITGNSQPGWNASFVIVFAAPLSNGNFGVQIVNPCRPSSRLAMAERQQSLRVSPSQPKSKVPLPSPPLRSRSIPVFESPFLN